MTESTNVETAQTGLTIQDLTLTLQVIQVASSRGAFKADELTAVGNLYDRIFKFLEASGAISKAPEAAPVEPVETVAPKAAKKSKAK